MDLTKDALGIWMCAAIIAKISCIQKIYSCNIFPSDKMIADILTNLLDYKRFINCLLELVCICRLTFSVIITSFCI